jgi:hypothetical protein
VRAFEGGSKCVQCCHGELTFYLVTMDVMLG